MFKDDPSDRVLDDLKRVLADAEQLFSTATEEAQGRSAETLQGLRERLARLESELGARAREGAQQAERYVSENPWQAVGIAAGVGLLLGVLLGRPRR